MPRRILLSLILATLPVLVTLGQPASGIRTLTGAPPQNLEILGVSVEGVTDEYTRGFVLQTSGLELGNMVVIPGDPSFSDAIRSIYRLGAYDDIRIIEERRVGQGTYLAIQVREVPKLAAYTFGGISKGDTKNLRKEVPLIARAPVRPSSIARAKQVIKEFYTEKGRPLSTVEVERTDNADGTVNLHLEVVKGPKVKVSEIIVNGNTVLSDGKIEKAMETKSRSWWRFWRDAKYQDKKFNEDLQRIVDKYNEEGFYDAKVVRDTSYLRIPENGKPGYVVEIDVREGPRYHIRGISWDGNTVYNDEVLSENLGFRPGDRYNGKRLESNLYMNGNNTDISSLYYNRGYMRFSVQPTIRVVGKDSMDLGFDVFEGDVYRYGTITVGGNTKTKEHVVRRELYTVPGQTFSRDEIQESIRRLMQLNYFTQESLGGGPAIDIAEEDKTVDLTYNLEETGSDQLELSGTWGRYGLVLQLRFGFNNFSAQNLFNGKAWKPLPSGDGQRLSLGIQTNGRRYQQYNLSFTEPWFRGRPTPIGFSMSFSQISGSAFLTSSGLGDLTTYSTNVFYEQRLSWPDDQFSTATQLGYQFYKNDDYITTLPQGISQEVTVRQTLSRNSENHPLFPSAGSKFSLSVELAPPLGDLIQYHKWRMSTAWHVPLTPKISLSTTANFGYIGSLTGDDVQFERFIVGGSPFETQGYFNYFGKEIVYMRGYPLGALGPRSDGDPIGGRVMNKFTSELKWMAVASPQLQAAPYLFMDAANAWDNFRAYNPTDLYRSAGFGVRLFLPILGLVELTYGYNYDAFRSINSKHDGSTKWTFQFSLGQGFGQ